MTFTIIDTHAHLDMPHFNSDRDKVISRAREAGVTTIINVGIDLKSSEHAIKLAEANSDIFAAVGFHPHEVSSVTTADVRRLIDLTRHKKVVAIGEIGLDYYRGYSTRKAQQKVLEWQLEVAADTGLPVIIHSRQAEKDMVATLRKWTSSPKLQNNSLRGIIHCFSGNIEIARQYLDMGFYISLGAYIGYPTSLSSHRTIRDIPTNRVLIETDSPFLPPQSRRGQRNEPSFLPVTLMALADIKEASLEVIAKETTDNARRVFRLL
ncbi:MAG: TatD family hydrolase [Chloroflexota bacterium]